MTTRFDSLEFPGISIINNHAGASKSCINELATWNGFSMNAVQGTQSGWRLDVASPNATNCALVLQRLITVLFEKKLL